MLNIILLISVYTTRRRLSAKYIAFTLWPKTGKREDLHAEGAEEDAEFKSCSLSRSALSAVLRVLSGEVRIGKRAKSKYVKPVIQRGEGSIRFTRSP
jgi:hypothetical protein